MEEAVPDGGLPATGNPADDGASAGPTIEEPRTADARTAAEIADAAAQEAAHAEETERQRAAAVAEPPEDPVAKALAAGPSAPAVGQERGHEGTGGKRGRGRGRGRTPGAGRGRSRTPKTRLKGPTPGGVPASRICRVAVRIARVSRLLVVFVSDRRAVRVAKTTS